MVKIGSWLEISEEDKSWVGRHELVISPVGKRHELTSNKRPLH